MAEINNQRKAFLDMLAWSGETDNGRQKPETARLWRHCGGGELFTDYSDHPRKTCHAKPKTQINRRRTLPASFLLVDAHRKQLGLKDSLRKVRTLWHCSRLRSVALYLWLIVVISVRQSTVAAISGLHCRALVMVSSSIRLTALSGTKEAAELSGDWCMSRVTTRLSPLWLSASSSACHGAVNHYRDNAITYKAQRQNARELKLAPAAITGHADASAWCCCARCKIHEGVKRC